MGIARQPDELGERLGEADDMLPRTGPDFKHDALFRQKASQHLSDRHTIARGRRRELSRIRTATGKRWSASDMSINCLTQRCASAPRPTKGETLATRSAARGPI